MISEAIESRFGRSIAIIIGIDNYENGIPSLKTAANDARRLATTLNELHNFEINLFLNEDASKERLSQLLNEQLGNELGADDRLIFYFAGHGVALDGDDGPNGYLLPQDARRGEEDTYLFMPFVHDALLSLPVRHALIIMDSCFSGAFRWAATRDLIAMPEVVHEERYDRFVKDPAWQVITSAAHDQKAMDQLSSGSLGTRPNEQGHSPFALALFEALEGKADVVPADGGDGLITATELYLYLESRLQPESIEQGLRQTPGFWPLARHDKGEFVFAAPGASLRLPPAPPLNYANNPYRGLESFEKQHAELFFGRDEVINDLEKCIDNQNLTVILGASGTGKSSLVKAGLLPRLELRHGLLVLPTVRPGVNPILSLSRALDTAANVVAIETRVSELCELNPRTILFIDQFEELITMNNSADERETTLQLLSRLLQRYSDKLDIVVTLRTDFEPQFSRGELNKFWKSGRYIIPPMSQNDLRECIMKPATARVMYFKPNELVEELINEVVATPGALPLLSFALSEMYIHYLERASNDRAIERIDYEAVGGVVGALRSRANAEYEALEDEEQRQIMRLIMLRMVAAGSGSVARRRVLQSELDFESAERNAMVKSIINRLVNARLVVTGNERSDDGLGAGDDYVEPAHDALVRAWGRLLRWVHKENERDPDDLRFQRKLTTDAKLWNETEVKSEKKGLLWNDAARSASLKSLLKSNVDWLSRVELLFANNSVLARRRIRQFWTSAMLIVVALAVLAIWQAQVATQQSKRAITRGIATEIRASLAEGNLYRALQVARRSVVEFKFPEETAIAMRAIATYESPLLTSFTMPSNAHALLSLDDRWIIAYNKPDQRSMNMPFNVSTMDWSGNQTAISDDATTVTLSPLGTWLMVTGYNSGDSSNALGSDIDCELNGFTDIFEISELGILKAPHLPAIPTSFLLSPKIGDQDSAVAIACETAIISINVSDLLSNASGNSVASPPDKFDTGIKVKSVFFDNNGQLVVVHDNSTSVYTRAGNLLFRIEGEAAAASADGRLVTAVNSRGESNLRTEESKILLYDSNGQLTARFDGRRPVLSLDGQRLAFENVGAEKGSTVVNLESEVTKDEIYTLSDGRKESLRIFETRYTLQGVRPRFSADGRLVMTLHGGRHESGRDGSSAEKTSVTNAASGSLLFEVAGEGVAFARNRPVLMTISGAEISLWDMRRFPTKAPLLWDEKWPSIDKEAFVALSSGGGKECDEWVESCFSPDEKTRVTRKEYYPKNSSAASGYEYVVTPDIASPLPKVVNFSPKLVEDFICGWTTGVQFSRSRPWVLLGCENGIQLAHLNGEILQSWNSCSGQAIAACSRVDHAYFSEDGKTIFEIRADRRVWVHTPGESKEQSLLLGPHEAFVSAVDKHDSGTIAIATGNGTIQVYDVKGELIQTMHIDVKSSPIKQVKFSKDGQVLFARDHQQMIHRWSISTEYQLELYNWLDALSDKEWNQLTE